MDLKETLNKNVRYPGKEAGNNFKWNNNGDFNIRNTGLRNGMIYSNKAGNRFILLKFSSLVISEYQDSD